MDPTGESWIVFLPGRVGHLEFRVVFQCSIPTRSGRTLGYRAQLVQDSLDSALLDPTG